MATYNLNSSIPSASSLKTGDILNCPYSGSYKTITLPKGTYLLECWGAQGGYRSSSTYGGKGGYAKGTLTLTANTTLYLYAGGAGNTGGTSGGFNGGGCRDTYSGGGGGSDIRIGQNSYYARVIVAGGGGSDGASSKTGGAGGGTNGQACQGGGFGTGGYYGTQTGLSSGSPASSKPTSSGSSYIYGGFGFGGYGSYYRSGYGGAGGGGWYGGCGSYPDSSADDDLAGGGGSGYVYTSATASNYPSGCLLNSNYYLTSTTLVDGTTSFTDYSGSTVTGHSGDGVIRITCTKIAVDVKPPTNVKITASKNKITISWTAPSGVTGIQGYIVKPYRNNSLISTSTVTGTSRDFTITYGGSYFADVQTKTSEATSSAARSNALKFDEVPPPKNLTARAYDGSTYFNWDASDLATAKYNLSIKSNSIEIISDSTDNVYYVYTPNANTSGSATIEIYAVDPETELRSSSISTNFSTYAPSPPTNLQGSIDKTGIATITWNPSTDTQCTGYSVYLLAPENMYVGRSPIGKPIFEFPFSNNSLTSNLIELSTLLINTFIYQLTPKTTYTFAVVSRSESHPGAVVSNSPKITFYYETALKFNKVKLTPTPAFTSERVLIEVGLEQKITPTITTS